MEMLIRLRKGSYLRAQFHKGTLLPIHRVFQYISQCIEAVTNFDTSIQMLNENVLGQELPGNMQKCINARLGMITQLKCGSND